MNTARVIIEAETPKGVWKALRSPRRDVKSIEVYGRRWFARDYGNTYFSVVAKVNGEAVVEIPYEYGYGSHCVERAWEELEKKGYVRLDRYPNGMRREVPSQYCKRKGIEYFQDITDVKRKRDL